MYYFINVFQKIIDIIRSFLYTIRVCLFISFSVINFNVSDFDQEEHREEHGRPGITSPQRLNNKFLSHLRPTAGNGAPEDSFASMLLSSRRILSETVLRAVSV